VSAYDLPAFCTNPAPTGVQWQSQQLCRPSQKGGKRTRV